MTHNTDRHTNTHGCAQSYLRTNPINTLLLTLNIPDLEVMLNINSQRSTHLQTNKTAVV